MRLFLVRLLWCALVLAPWLCWSGSAVAQADVGHQGLLWVVDRPDNAHIPPSHLFGTVHVDDPRVLAVRPSVMEALDHSRRVLLELLLDADSGTRFQAAAQLPPSQSLRKLAGAAVFERVTGVLAARYGIAADAADRLQPWAAFLTLSQPPGPHGVTLDERLGQRAAGHGIPVAGLETLDEQLAALAAIPLPSQLVLLDAAAREHDAVVEAVDALLQRYLAEDLDGLATMERRIGDTDADDDAALRQALDDLFDHLVRRRNQCMLQRLLPQLAQGGVFAAMGALHLQGDQGLLQLLQRAGWRVRRVQ